ncbi:MAG: DUF3857 domain-containing protein [Candidatus Omnitrophica bacterium]|nr:DUF3857 domain-containing protein [Candidatus Omnitrophota bacterium]
MHIIDTDGILNMKDKRLKIHTQFKKFTFSLSIFYFLFFIFNFLIGCGKNNQLEQARNYSNKSQDYYQQAVKEYKDLIDQSRNLGQANLELGLLYYKHAEYELAGRHLLKTSAAEAKKYRALSLYRSNDFTEAKEAFKKIENPDSETLFFYGQTCEKLNLYDEALGIYSRVLQQPFSALAGEQIQSITKSGENIHQDNLPQELSEAINAAPGAEKYPNAAALILLSDELINISAENTAVFSEHFLIKILNERGKQNFSEIVIGYDSTYEKVELEYARTIRPDGIVVPVGSRHIRDVSKYLNFPLYSNARARIISFPEITEGSIIEYKYKIYRNELINENDFRLAYYLQESEPVIKARFKLILPADKPLHYKFINADYNTHQARLEPQVKDNRGYKEYLWEFRDIPAIIPEADMPPASKINTIILISTFDSWEEVYRWWWKLARDKIHADSSIKQKVQELTQGKDSVIEKVKAIYNFSAKDIRYVAVEYGQAGYEPHKASDIFFNKYGDCKDQAVLLVAMLREIGVQGFPVLIGTQDYLNLEEDFPSVNFNHCIAAVELEGEIVFLDPTCSTCSFDVLPAGDQERKVLAFSDQGYRILDTPLYPAEHDYLKQVLKIEISPEEAIQAQRSVYTSGLYDASQRFWLKYSSDEAISESLKQAIQNISPASRLIKYDIENLDDMNKSIVLSYSFSGKEYWARAGNLRIFPHLAVLDTSVVAKESRRYPLDLGTPGSKITRLDVILPAGFEIYYLPDNFQKKSPWMDIDVKYNMEENNFYFQQITRLKIRDIPLSEYPEFKDFIEGISRQIRERVVFRSD